MTIFADTDASRDWRTYLETLSPPASPVSLPQDDAFLSTLRYLEIPDEDIPDVIALAPTLEANPDLWWYLERAVWSLVATMGDTEGPPPFAALRDINDPEYRFFYVLVFTAALPRVQEYHRSLGIPGNISQATLADLGRNVRVHRKREGIGGLGVQWWLMLHFRGMIYQLGRLQFELTTLRDNIAEGIRETGEDVDTTTPVLSIHIPDFSGPMTPEACDESIARAREFFPRYFPDIPLKYAVCSSWLLDPRLKEYLRPDSNIIRFQDRFHLASKGWDSNVGIMQFVFGKTPDAVDTVSTNTSLEKAVVSHIKAGGTWWGYGGWFPLNPPDSAS